MIPLKDTIPSRSMPYVNIFIIILNFGLFFYELSLGRVELARLLYTYGLIPRRFFYLSQEVSSSFISQFLPLFTSMFLHGGWFHILGNMLFLWIFGDNVEDAMGHFKYFIFYILCGVASSFFHLYLNPLSSVPAVGASGAISGVMGAYFLLFPASRIITLVPFLFFFTLVEIPAFFFLGLWFIFQLFSGAFSLLLRGIPEGGIAWWAHVGGFISGMALRFIFVRKRYRRYRRYFSDYW